MEKTTKKRRKFIKALILAAVSLPLFGKYLIPRIQRRKLLLQVNKSDLPGNGTLVFKEKQIAVIRQGQQVYALETVCTHLGCTVNATPKGFACPCHGSIFSPRGKVLHGPADRPLSELAIEERADHIEVLKNL